MTNQYPFIVTFIWISRYCDIKITLWTRFSWALTRRVLKSVESNLPHVVTYPLGYQYQKKTNFQNQRFLKSLFCLVNGPIYVVNTPGSQSFMLQTTAFIFCTKSYLVQRYLEVWKFFSISPFLELTFQGLGLHRSKNG